MSTQAHRSIPICRRLASLTLGAISVAIAIVSPTPAWAAGDAAKDIRIGMVNAQTGPAAALGQGMRAGAQAVFSEVNAAGGVYGRKITLKVADDSYEPARTQAQTTEMIEREQVLALFGYVGTPTVNAVLPLLREADVPLVGVFSGAKSLRNPVTPQLFNVRASYDEETDSLVHRLLESGARKIAVVYQNDGFGQAVLTGVDAALMARNLKVHATGHYERNTVHVGYALRAMMEAEPDAIVLAGPYLPVAAFVKQARQSGSKAMFATVSFVGTESLLSKLGSDADGMYISQVMPSPRSTTTRVVQECRDALKRTADEALTYINLEGCVSAKLLVQALKDAGPDPTRKTLAATLEKMDDINLGGFTIAFSPDNHQASNLVLVTKVLGGNVVAIR